MKSVLKKLSALLGKVMLILLGLFLVTFAVYMTNAENKLIYYVVRPFLNKHYDAQNRARGI